MIQKLNFCARIVVFFKTKNILKTMTSESKKEQPPPLFQSFPLHECCREGQYDKMIEILNNSKDVKKLIEKKDEDERTVRDI